MPLFAEGGAAAPSLDEAYLAQSVLGAGVYEEGATPFQGVRRLRAGEALIVRDGQVRFETVDSLRPLPESHAHKEWIERFWQTLDASLRPFADAPDTCLALSGGVDSTAIASAVARNSKPPRAYVMTSPSSGAEETQAVAAFAKAFPETTIERVDVTEVGDLAVLDGLPLRDEPPLVPLSTVLMELLLWRAVRAAGYRAVIDGNGADEIFADLLSPFNAVRSGAWLTAWRSLRPQPNRRALFWRSVVLPLLPQPARRPWIRRWMRSGAAIPGYVTWNALDRPVVKQAVERYWAGHVHCDYPAALRRWLSSPEPLAYEQARRRMAASFGIELVSPYLDRRILELALALPQQLVLGDGAHKAFLREATRGRLPDAIRLRPKDTFLADSLSKMIVTSRGARMALRDENVRKRLADWVRFDRLDATLDAIAGGWPAPDRLLWQLERLLAFAQWYARVSREYGVD